MLLCLLEEKKKHRTIPNVAGGSSARDQSCGTEVGIIASVYLREKKPVALPALKEDPFAWDQSRGVEGSEVYGVVLIYLFDFRHTQKAEELIKAQQAKKQAHHPSHSQSSTGQSPGAGGDNTDDGPAQADWTYDPNEPRYCLCNQVSYGDMVGCDNNDVSYVLGIIVFHIQCSPLNSGSANSDILLIQEGDYGLC